MRRLVSLLPGIVLIAALIACSRNVATPSFAARPAGPHLAQWKRTMHGIRLQRPDKYLLQGAGGPVDHSEGAIPRKAGGPPPGYTVTRTASGIQLSVHFARRSYPAHALIPVTATLRNLSHKHLAVVRWRSSGLCSFPAISFESVDSAGRSAEPIWPITPPALPCPFMPPKLLSIGHSITEHQLIVLWTPRLSITAQVFNFEHNCFCGFPFQGPTARFSLYQSVGSPVIVSTVAGNTVATVRPPPGVTGGFYYRSWGHCGLSFGSLSAVDWTARQDRIIPAICAHPTTWHLDVAWLNWPVTTLNLGVRSG